MTFPFVTRSLYDSRIKYARESAANAWTAYHAAKKETIEANRDAKTALERVEELSDYNYKQAVTIASLTADLDKANRKIKRLSK